MPTHASTSVTTSAPPTVRKDPGAITIRIGDIIIEQDIKSAARLRDQLCTLLGVPDAAA